jgi:murein DD-endopeptidase MepM/ murein hydrolase activator NlpD
MSRTLFLLLAFLAAAPTLADTQHYPFKLAIRAESGKQIVMAQNDGPAPILATVSLLNPVNAIINQSSPIVLVVKPGESIPIASVRGSVAGQRYSISTSFKFSIGNPDAIHDPASTYRLPFQDGQAIMIGQMVGGRITTHTAPDSRYAIDFDIPIGTPVVAARKGWVVDIDQGYTEGGNNPSLKANHVLILQEDGTLAMYSHLSANRTTVSFGQWVEAGALIGYSGNTGYSTGPHLHFAVLTNTRTPDGTAKYVSVPVTFVNDAPGQAIRLFQDETLVTNFGGRLPPHVRAGITAGVSQAGSIQTNPK